MKTKVVYLFLALSVSMVQQSYASHYTEVLGIVFVMKLAADASIHQPHSMPKHPYGKREKKQYPVQQKHVKGAGNRGR